MDTCTRQAQKLSKRGAKHRLCIQHILCAQVEALFSNLQLLCCRGRSANGGRTFLLSHVPAPSALSHFKLFAKVFIPQRLLKTFPNYPNYITPPPPPTSRAAPFDKKEISPSQAFDFPRQVLTGKRVYIQATALTDTHPGCGLEYRSHPHAMLLSPPPPPSTAPPRLNSHTMHITLPPPRQECDSGASSPFNWR